MLREQVLPAAFCGLPRRSIVLVLIEAGVIQKASRRALPCGMPSARPFADIVVGEAFVRPVQGSTRVAMFISQEGPRRLISE